MKNGLHRNDKQLQDYHMGGSTIYANRDVSFSVEKGELAIILGSSGAGKSTVLNILGGMDSNDSGKVIIDGKDISKYSRTRPGSGHGSERRRACRPHQQLSGTALRR